MSNSMQEITAENSRWIMNSQALVEGVLKLPETLEEISTILDITGLGEVTEARLASPKIAVDGVANFCVLYLDKAGNFSSFNSECTFNHAIDAPTCTPDMRILALAEMQDVSYGVVDGSAISVRAIVSMDIYAMGNRKYGIMDTNPPEKHTRIKSAAAMISRVECAKPFRSYVKSELRVPQSMPAVKRVLSERGYAMVRSIVLEPGKAIVEGEVRVFIVYESTDKNAPLQYLTETLPYGEIINDEGIRKGASVVVLASLERLEVESDEENPDMLEISAVINHSLVCRGQNQMNYIEDLYDEEAEVELERESIGVCNILARECQKKIVRLSVEIPDTAPEVSRTLFACAYPKITSAKADNDRVMLSGMMGLVLCYTTTDAGPKNTRISVPFETEVAYPDMRRGADLWVKSHAEYAIAEGSGRELEVKCCLDICIWEVDSGVVEPISGVHFQPMEGVKQSGVVVYYTNGEETMWDIAKKFKIKKDVMEEITEDVKIEKGKRLVLIRR